MLELATAILFSLFLASGVLVTCFILLFSYLVVVNPLYYDHLLIMLFLPLEYERSWSCAFSVWYVASAQQYVS